MRKFRVGLSTRIALTMLTALLLLQGLNAATFFFLPPPTQTIYSARWLISETSEATKKIFDVETTRRKDVAKTLSDELHLFISWDEIRMEPPSPERVVPEFFIRLERSLRASLSGTVRSVSIEARGGPAFPGDNENTQFVPAGFEQHLPTGVLANDEPDIPIIGGFSILVRGSDGSWLHIESQRPPRLGPLFSPPMITAAGAILLISFLSIWTAKRTLSPIDDLVSAAQRLGIDRNATPIDTKKLGDFAVVGRALNEMQNRIKNFVDERTHMLAAISHDLRTSLTRLRLTTEELADSPSKDALVKNVEEMEQMLSATLAFASDDLKREKAERVDLGALLITICDNFLDAGACVYYQGPDHLLTACQPIATKRAFMNIVDNAVKYGESAHVGLRLNGEHVVVTVRDNGPGIPDELIETAFQPFQRLEQSRNRETGGVGLGLAIARDIISAQGGTIALNSPRDGGLLATLQLPRSL
ncbi:ATP-binding protein [Hyphomicrobium sp. MC1]|uniref:ATP-binding protein n=1 Tax=Hyphomicrobium sp. (strain MC1) TaxID=717785 RepID=UPI000213D5AD|nr:ATP-binding protein [Hyphomicrobium sp. MC1]CCB65021.1 Histidine kinase [Hyphomicrobium sp. MC1]